MRGQIRGLDQATRNSQDGISLIQTAEGALNETHSILQRMRELAVQASTDTNTTSDRAEIQKEVEQLKAEITRISTDTEFNTKKLLNGAMGKVATYTAGALNVKNLVVTGGDDLVAGAYSISVTAVGTNNQFANFVNTATGTLAVGGLAVTGGADIKYGSYSLAVTNYNGVAHTADYTLTGPDGTITAMSGRNTEASLNIGGITVTQAAGTLTSNGTITFGLQATGLNLNITGATAVDPAAFDYKGGKLSYGGFEFELTTNWGGAAAQYDFNVQNNAVKFHIGANANQNVSLAVNDMSAKALRVDAIDLSSQAGANAAITTIETALETVSSERAKLGAMQNRLEHTINNLTTSSENLSASESRVRDVDMAKEMMNFTKTNILTQAATAMLAQANQQPQGVLQLLK